jgi:hypothetical protein
MEKCMETLTYVSSKDRPSDSSAVHMDFAEGNIIYVCTYTSCCNWQNFTERRKITGGWRRSFFFKSLCLIGLEVFPGPGNRASNLNIHSFVHVQFIS